MNRLFYIFFFLCFLAYSQEELNIYMEELNVQKKYNFEILKKNKIIYQPIFIDTSKVEKIKVQYIKSDNFKFSLDQSSYLTNPPKIKREFPSYQNNILSLAYGNQDAFQLEYSYKKLFDFKRNIFFQLNNYSKDFILFNNFLKNEGNNSHKFISIDGFSNSSLFFCVNQLNSNSEVYSDFDIYSQNGLYYGNMSEEDLDILSPYSGLGLGVNVNLNRISEKAFLKDLNISYKYHSARNVRLQSHYKLSSRFYYDLGLIDLNTNINVDFIKNKLLSTPNFISPNVVQKNSSTYFEYFNKNSKFFSSIKSIFGFLNQSFGFDYNIVIDDGSRDFYFFPYINLYNKKYNISFEFNSSIQPYYFSTISKNNPFLTPFFEDHFSKKSIFKLSFSKKINSNFSINSNLSYLNEKNNLVPFLINDNIHTGSPIAMYFDNANKLKLNFNLSYNYNNIETFFNIYFTEISSEFYKNLNYEPLFSFDYFFQIEPIENLLFSFDILYYSKRDALSPASLSLENLEINSINNFFALNFDVNYLLNDTFRINFGLKNLMDFQYEFFDGYTFERGRRLMVNLTYSF